MSAHPCGCDPEAHWRCREYPECAYGRYVTKNPPIEPILIYEDPESMTLKEFQSSISCTYKPNNVACHGLGIAGEAGEVADIIKKALFHDDVPVANLCVSKRRDDMRKELGDVLWYVAAVASDWGFTLDEVAQENIRKLAERYPNGFVKGGGVRHTKEEKIAFVQALLDSALPLRAGGCSEEPTVDLRGGAPQHATGVFFNCGCSERTIDGQLTRTYCKDGECRRLKR